MVESITYDDSTKELLLTIDLIQWRQPSYNERTDSEIITKTLKFTGISHYELSPITLIFDNNDILEMKFIPTTDDEQVEFILDGDDIIKLTIQAEHVEWIDI
ncbi:hypothetical protein [Paenibacillus donghaensis]|uniref:Uncharacterized protein n=1 Tax=Paenibacillus donghaensis TaxID=414771 RepID=A0A2Z2KI61_9BACL|nr:hypothetical protein [Paenibacillus donghaensis]ASA21899.1 hypothetical protein B9T62_14610 [Paenibacillus donghaensis]